VRRGGVAQGSAEEEVGRKAGGRGLRQEGGAEGRRRPKEEGERVEGGELGLRLK
jgi:hypothetical protein